MLPTFSVNLGLAIKPPTGYEISQRIRKRIEEIFGWIKTTGGYAKPNKAALGPLKELSIRHVIEHSII